MTQEQKVIRNKVGLIKLAQQLDSVSKACKVMGFSRDSFYRARAHWKDRAHPDRRDQPARRVSIPSGALRRRNHAFDCAAHSGAARLKPITW
jgi:hypothetical protein